MLRRFRPTLLLCALLFSAAAAPRPLLAQHDSLPVGVRLRAGSVVPPGARQAGTLIASDSVSLTLLTADYGERRILLNDLTRLDLHVSRRSAGSAFAQGAGVGFLVGLGIGTIATGAMAVYESTHGCGDCIIPGTVIVGILSAGFTAASTVIGGGVGLATRDRWRRVTIP